MYRFPSNLTCKTELTVKSHDEDFFDIMFEILHGSDSIESPVSVKKWSSEGDTALFAYIGIIIIHDATIAKFDPETLSQMISDVILYITQANDSMVMTQKILVCKGSDTSLITQFHEMHNVEVDLDNLISDIGYWSTFFENITLKPSFKPSKHYEKLQ